VSINPFEPGLDGGQPDIRLAREIGRSDARWKLRQSVIIEGKVDREALEFAICQVVREAEPIKASLFETDGRVYQRPLDYPCPKP